MRTDMCGELGAADVGRQVAVCGWVARRREHGEHLAFVDLRDRTGSCSASSTAPSTCARSTSCASSARCATAPRARSTPTWPPVRSRSATATVEILSVAEPPPFPLDERIDTDESIRLRHRYLDLRTRPHAAQPAAAGHGQQRHPPAMEEQGFVEIETPMLIASTPEGARDFVVPSGSSPARSTPCPRAPSCSSSCAWSAASTATTRSPAACATRTSAPTASSSSCSSMPRPASSPRTRCSSSSRTRSPTAVEAVTGERPGEIPHMTWHEAMERFGSDKPDTRFGMELVELTELFAATEFNAFKAPCVKGLRVEGGAERTRKQLDDLTDTAKRYGAKGLVWMKVEPDGTSPHQWPSSCPRPSWTASSARSRDSPATCCCSWPTSGARCVTCSACSASSWAARRSTRGASSSCGWSTSHCSKLSTTTAPRSRRTTRSRCPTPTTSTCSGGTPEQLLDVRSQAYDLVVNGWELGSGSVRIHRSDVQQQIFSILGIAPDEGPGQVRVPARRLPLRAPAPRRVRLRHRPSRRHPGRRGEHPRGDRVPEDPVGWRSPHQRTQPHRSCPARRARPAAAATPQLSGVPRGGRSVRPPRARRPRCPRWPWGIGGRCRRAPWRRRGAPRRARCRDRRRPAP
jgi:aspartyl-tRNA synthetase